MVVYLHKADRADEVAPACFPRLRNSLCAPIDDSNTTIYSPGFSTTKPDMKHQADEFNSDLTPAPAHGCLAKDQSNGSDTHTVQVPDGKGNNRAMQALA
jgi:hypothetical protein